MCILLKHELIFISRRINQSETLLRLKWGVSHMLLTAHALNNTAPIIVPFIHHGMDKIMPLAKESMYIIYGDQPV